MASKESDNNAAGHHMEEPLAFTPDHIDAINQIFTEFELAYHNQYHKAFPSIETFNLARQLWLKVLVSYSPQRIVQAARKVITESEYLPTPHSILKYCEPKLADYGLPDARHAYYEACRATSPKAEYKWSHPAVYFAGKETDWFFISSNIEAKAFPVFERNYAIICERVINGEELFIAIPKALPEEISQPLSSAEKKQRLKELRKEIGI